MTEGQTLGDTIGIGLVHFLGSAKAAAALRVFRAKQMPLAGAGAHDFASTGNFKPFGD
ncbi:MAG: hypothetical protein JWQ71_473 [Pedosphaera sp.]|nr:hypothetical protein [Pedosphaera sp.]